MSDHVPDELYPAETFWARAVTLEEVAGPSTPFLAASSSGTQASLSRVSAGPSRSVSLATPVEQTTAPHATTPKVSGVRGRRTNRT